MGMFITRIGLYQFIGVSFRRLHIGVGFCVARSTMVGNAKASESGTSNSTDSRALFLCLFLLANHAIWESMVQK
jgi:hypothetical protein